MKGPFQLLKLSVLLLLISAFSYIFWQVLDQTIDLETKIINNYQNLEISKTKLESDYEQAEYQAHLALQETKQIEEIKKQVEDDFEKYKQEVTPEKLAKIEEIYTLYEETTQLIEKNRGVSLDVSSYDDATVNWGLQFLNQEFDGLKTNMETAKTELEANYQEYVASLPTPTPTPRPQPTSPPVQVQPAEGYSYQNVSTSRGTFGSYIIKLSLSSATVKTVTANDNNCTNNCPAKSLATYIAENNAYAGMHGTYFCPPDYSACSNKTYSYDFGVYNSNLNKWLNEHALSWNDLGLLTFNGSSATFYRDSKNYGGQTVTAGMSNFPSLLENGSYAVNEGSLTSYQKDVRGTRGAVGVDSSNIYLVISSGATVPDMAYVMQALGAQQALNLDGGGSSAMFIGGAYKVGPGRSLPNAILLIR